MAMNALGQHTLTDVAKLSHRGGCFDENTLPFTSLFLFDLVHLIFVFFLPSAPSSTS